jgi:hypothetical protein
MLSRYRNIRGRCLRLDLTHDDGAGEKLGRGIFRHARAAATAASVALALLLMAPAALAQDPCVVADAGTGTVALPPIGCDYLSPSEVHEIIDGLPPGTTIEFAPIHKDFICNDQATYSTCTVPLPPGVCEGPGGGLGGNADCFASTLEFQVTGTGGLAGFNRVISIPASTEIHTGPRNPFDSTQDFDTEIVALQADLFGDPDFDFISIRAGSVFGLPSPGHTTLTQLPSGDWNVDSFFDITYQIEFVGAPGSVLEGFAGATVANLTMGAGVPAPNANACEQADNGTGTVTLPPDGCEYLSPDEFHEVVNGLPPDTTIVVDAIHKRFLCGGQGIPQPPCSVAVPPGECETPGGSLGGTVDCFHSDVELQLTGTGALAGFSRTISLPASTEVHAGPRTPGDETQSFDTEMVALQAAIFGDPDFDLLRVTAGSDQGLPPSSGHTTLTDLGNGSFNVDSFFDVVYTIEFVGAPGGSLDGLSGVSQGSVTMGTGQSLNLVPGLSTKATAVIAILLMAAASLLITRRRQAKA